MPAGSRVRANNVYGTVSDNPLLMAAVSFTSLGLSLLPAISGQHAVIVLDPKRVFGEPEIVVVTSHLAMGTTATITRAAYGTTARDHPQGTAWAHVPVGPDDYIPIVTSGTRPSDPYRGQLIFETDTDKFVGRSIVDTWVEAIPLGAWQTWTPTLTNMTLGGGSVIAKYVRVGRIIHGKFRFTLGAGSAMGTGPYFTPPVPLNTATYPANSFMGAVFMTDVTTNINTGFIQNRSGTNEFLMRVSTAGGTYVGFADITAAIPFAWASTHYIEATFTYEAAS